MKKVVILLMAISLFAACNNDKGGKKADYREKDDYSNTDEKNKDEQGDEKSRKDDNDGNINSDNGWSERDQNKVLTECMTGFGERQDIGKKICPCILEKVMKKYASFEEVNRATEEEGKKLGQECARELNINVNQNDGNNDAVDDNQGNNAGAGWPESEIKDFSRTCVAAAQKNGMEYLDAQSYCDCMQYKLEKMYPNVNDSRLKNLSLESPTMKAMVKSCLPGN